MKGIRMPQKRSFLSVGRAAVVIAAVVAGSFALAAPASAKTSADGGDFAVTVGDVTMRCVSGAPVSV